MKSFARLCAALGVFCAVPISSPPIARGSAAPRNFTSRASLPFEPAPLFEHVASTPYSGAPPVTRLQILDIARSAVGNPYLHGAESWLSDGTPRGGVDCSGLIAKAWQVPRAAESWEALTRRPTTETLARADEAWFPLPIAERRPGDVLVRYGALVRHAFIYERDDVNFHDNGAIWVFEAAQPRVQHRRYRLADLGAYTLTRRRGMDDVGLVGRSRTGIFDDLIAAFRAAGGERFLGTPYDRGDGLFVHSWASAADFGVAQDFHGGSFGEALLVRGQHQQAAYILSGAALEVFRARLQARFLLRPAQ